MQVVSLTNAPAMISYVHRIALSNFYEVTFLPESDIDNKILLKANHYTKLSLVERTYLFLIARRAIQTLDETLEIFDFDSKFENSVLIIEAKKNIVYS